MSDYELGRVALPRLDYMGMHVWYYVKTMSRKTVRRPRNVNVADAQEKRRVRAKGPVRLFHVEHDKSTPCATAALTRIEAFES